LLFDLLKHVLAAKLDQFRFPQAESGYVPTPLDHLVIPFSLEIRNRSLKKLKALYTSDGAVS
jgi:hypothetical protein